MAPVDGFRAGRRSPLGRWAGLAACVLGAFWGRPLTGQSPAGTVIANQARVTFVAANGAADSAASNTVAVTVGRMGGVSLVAAQTVQALPGDTVVFLHTLSNTQNLSDAFSLTGSSVNAWPVTLFRDRNANGALDAPDTPWTGPDSIVAGGTAAVLVVVAVPNTRAVRGVTDLVTVRAASAWSIASALPSALTPETTFAPVPRAPSTVRRVTSARSAGRSDMISPVWPLHTTPLMPSTAATEAM